jgi:hypothetical protein
MTITRHAITIEPEVQALIDGLDPDRQYAIGRDLVPHEIVWAGRKTGERVGAFYDVDTSREIGLVIGGDYIRLTALEVQKLRDARERGLADAVVAGTISSMNRAAHDCRTVAAMVAAHAELDAAEQAVEAARTRRDELVRQVNNGGLGMTGYRIAKMLGVAESTVGRILR